MSSTVYKKPLMSPEIPSVVLVPIGLLSEDAQIHITNRKIKEFLKRHRKHNSRICSRVKENENVFKLFLISRNPHIPSKNKIKKQKLKQLPTEVESMLKAQSIDVFDNNDMGSAEEVDTLDLPQDLSYTVLSD